MTASHPTTRMVMGVIGHVDHGKTALVRALTGMETDRLPEEQRRGISIALGFAHLELAGATVDLIDMPGHERFVRTLVGGATGIDAVLLVVAANEGIKPQTVEHVDIASLLDIRRAVIAITKADLVSSERLAEVSAEVAALAAGVGIGAAVPVAVSATDGTGIPALLSAITVSLAGIAPRVDAAAPFMPIDRAFSVAGHGTVVTGTLRGGALMAGQELLVLPADLPVRVRGLQVHGARQTSVQPGQRVAVNLRGVEPASVRPGAALCAPGLLRPTSWLCVEVRAVAGAPPLATTALVRLLVGTQEVDARLRLLDREILQPGQTAIAQLRCAEPVAVPSREHFVLRLPSPPVTVGGGRILDTETPRLRRHASAAIRRLQSLAGDAPTTLVPREAAGAGVGGTSLRRLASLAGIGPAVAAQYLQGAPVQVLKGGAVVSDVALAEATKRVAGALGTAEHGVPLGQFRSALPDIGPAVLDEAVARLAKAGTVRQEAGAVRPVQPETEARRASDVAQVAGRLATLLRQGGLMPPDQATLAPDPPTRRVLAQLVREGVAIRAPDRAQNRELLFHRDAIDAARRQLAPHLRGAGLKVTEAGTLLGISRKYSVPLLEYLDSVQFTRRVEDRRVLGPRGVG